MDYKYSEILIFFFFSNYSNNESFCNMYYACLKDAAGNYKKFSFLCPPGSSFNPTRQMCDIRFNVDCDVNQERKGKNMFSFAIKAMHTGDPNDYEEEEQTVTKENSKKARQLFPRMR